MRPTRKIIAEFICVFLIGSLAGGLMTYCYTDKGLTPYMSRWNDPDQLVKRIDDKYTTQYHLTPDEISRIQPLVKDMAQSLYKVRHQFGVDILSTLDNYHQQIAAQLTPEHRAAYLKAMDDRKKSLNTMLLPDQSSPTQGQK